MLSNDPIKSHRQITKKLADQLEKKEIFTWLMTNGYFPESYVMPPCFKVTIFPEKQKQFVIPDIQSKKTQKYNLQVHECLTIRFPKTRYTDRTFGLIHPQHHNDIVYNITNNWKKILAKLIPHNSVVTSYSFPIPLTKRQPGRMGKLRSGRLIYEFIEMTDDDLAAVAYKYSHIARADIKNFYPSIYTHSIAWALHGKNKIRNGNTHRYDLLGNRLDKLFQYSNDRCTNGIPIGPVVSDIVAEIIASAVDIELTKYVKKNRMDCVVVRFKDDYRILTKTEDDGAAIIKALQASLRLYNLELNDEKTNILNLPDGLFREWVSKYHLLHPRKKSQFTWKQFRELYLGVISIDKTYPGTGVIDRFLSDIVSKKGNLKIKLHSNNLEKAVSMLLLLGPLRNKSFPKIIAIIESILHSLKRTTGATSLVGYLEKYFQDISKDEERNGYLLCWLMYFFKSNGLSNGVVSTVKFKDPILKSLLNSRSELFPDATEFNLFEDPLASKSKHSMLEYLDVFKVPD